MELDNEWLELDWGDLMRVELDTMSGWLGLDWGDLMRGGTMSRWNLTGVFDEWVVI